MIKKFERSMVIEAIRFLGTKESFDEIRAWVGDNFYYDYQNTPWVFLDTDSCKGVQQDNWVVKQNGKFSVMTDADMSYFKKMPQDVKATFKELI